MRMLPVPMQSVPRSHKDIDARLPFMTNGGIEGSIIVVKQLGDTTNDTAKFLMKKRILAAAQAKDDRVGLGVDLKVRVEEKDKDIVTLRIEQPGGKIVTIPVEPMSDGSYMAMKQRFPDLRRMTAGIMEKYEMHQAAMISASAGSSASHGMRR